MTQVNKEVKSRLFEVQNYWDAIDFRQGLEKRVKEYEFINLESPNEVLEKIVNSNPKNEVGIVNSYFYYSNKDTERINNTFYKTESGFFDFIRRKV